MTAPLEVDATGWVIRVLNAAGVARAGNRTPDNLQDVMPFIRVTRVGGPDDGHMMDLPTMVLHAFAYPQEAANGVLYRAGTVLRAQIGVAQSGAVLSWLRKMSGPQEAEYENPAVRHAVSTYQLHIKTSLPV